MNLNDTYENDIDPVEYFSACEIGMSLDGEPIYSLRKILKRLKKEGYNTIEVLENLNIHLAPLKSIGVIILYDID